MGRNSDINHRMAQIGQKYKLTAVERSRKIKSLSVTENKVKNRLQDLESQKKQIQSDIDECNSHLTKIAAEKRHIDQLKSPVVTEHALLRYLERYEGVDMNLIHDKVLNLPDSDKIKAGMTIVTVFPDEDDHFNLAERETL